MSDNVIRVAVLDQYHPGIVDTINRGVPPGWEISFAKSRKTEDQTAALANADVAFVMAAPVTGELLGAASKLKFIQKLGAGVDKLDQDTCTARGIAVACLAGGNAIPVAEHTVLLMLATYRRLVEVDRRTRAGEWGKEESRGINRHMDGKRVGIVGFGAIGKAVAKLLTGFGVDIVYYDPVDVPAEVEREFNAKRLTLEELLKTADIVTLHLPLLPQTKGMIGEKQLRSMKKGAVLINCARGGLVDEDALYRVLKEGHLFAAGVDAFANEPPTGSPLLTLDQTIVSPHLAGATVDNFAKIVERAVANTQQYLGGKGLPPRDAVLLPKGATSVAAK